MTQPAKPVDEGGLFGHLGAEDLAYRIGALGYALYVLADAEEDNGQSGVSVATVRDIGCAIEQLVGHLQRRLGGGDE